MSLLCATVDHEKMPNRTKDWANNNTTPLRLCPLVISADLPFVLFFLSIGFLWGWRGKGKKFLLSEPSAGVLFLCWLLVCNSNTVTIADPRHQSSPPAALDILPGTLHLLPTSQRKGISPSPAHVYDGTPVLPQQSLHYFWKLPVNKPRWYLSFLGSLTLSSAYLKADKPPRRVCLLHSLQSSCRRWLTAQRNLAGTASVKDTVTYRAQGWRRNFLGFLWNKGY